jgi:DNA-binding Lrp family transcriptional regulator
MQLNKKDQEIIRQLDNDARQSISSIAKKVKLSKEVVNYRIKRLEKLGLIEGYYTTVDISKLGYMYCRLFIRYHNTPLDVEKEIIDYCKNHPKIGWVALGDGRWDITIVVWARNIKELEDVYDDLRYKYSKFFRKVYISLALEIHHFKHNYLYGDPVDNSTAILGEGKERIFRLKDKDLQVVALLTKDARISTTAIAKKLCMTPNAVKYKIKKLMKDRIIMNFRPKLNTRLLDYEHYKIFLKLDNSNKKTEAELFRYMKSIPNVVYITKALGDADIEFEIMLKGRNRLYEFMRQLKGKFAALINDYETVLYYKEPMIDYLPSELIR